MWQWFIALKYENISLLSDQCQSVDSKFFQQHLLDTFRFLRPEDLDALWPFCQLRSLRPKEELRKAGDPATEIYFVRVGTLRGYLLLPSGEERTLFIRGRGKFFGPPEALSAETKSALIVDAIQASEVMVINFPAFEQLTHTNLALSRLFIEALKENTLALVFRVKMLAGKSPGERYDILLAEYPELFEEAQHQYIANYLGITPNSLSRIIRRRASGDRT